MLVGSLREDLGEDPGSWVHINSTLTRESMWFMLIISMLIPPTHIGLFSVRGLFERGSTRRA